MVGLGATGTLVLWVLRLGVPDVFHVIRTALDGPLFGAITVLPVAVLVHGALELLALVIGLAQMMIMRF